MNNTTAMASGYADEEMDWKTVCPLEDIPALGARVIESPDGDIAIFRTSGNEVFALRDHCPHKGGPLSQGIIFDHKVACPLHDWKINLDTGMAVAPDEGCAARYPVKVYEGTVFLALTSARECV